MSLLQTWALENVTCHGLLTHMLRHWVSVHHCLHHRFQVFSKILHIGGSMLDLSLSFIDSLIG